MLNCKRKLGNRGDGKCYLGNLHMGWKDLHFGRAMAQLHPTSPCVESQGKSSWGILSSGGDPEGGHQNAAVQWSTVQDAWAVCGRRGEALSGVSLQTCLAISGLWAEPGHHHLTCSAVFARAWTHAQLMCSCASNLCIRWESACA